MRTIRYVAVAVVLGALLVQPTGSVLVQHGASAQNFLCVGQGSASTGCDIAWFNYSVESRQGDGGKVNCPNTSVPECYDSYDDSRRASPGWGPNANTPLVPMTTVGPLTTGLYYGTSGSAARVWFGICAQQAGCGSAAASGGQNADGDAFVCVTAYGDDHTDGRQVSKVLNDAGVSDDRTDYDSDGQVCGEVGRGL